MYHHSTHMANPVTRRLWRRNAWGYIVTVIAGIQGSLYLLVLSTSSAVAILRGLAEAPDELPLWKTLAATTTAVTFLLLANVWAGGNSGSDGPSPWISARTRRRFR